MASFSQFGIGYSSPLASSSQWASGSELSARPAITDDSSIRESWKKWLKADTNDDKSIVDTVNALIAVAAFIAGVQAQIISFTLPLPKDALGRTTNFFAVVGLMFDIVGTFLGVIHALLLQRRIRHKSGLYDDIDKLESRKTQEGTDESQVITSSLLRYVGQSKPPPLSRRYTDPWFKMVFSFGFIPLLSMGFGVLFLVITTLLFSVRAFEREVVIGCGSVLGGVVVLSFLPLWHHGPFNSVISFFRRSYRRLSNRVYNRYPKISERLHHRRERSNGEEFHQEIEEGLIEPYNIHEMLPEV